MSHYPPAYPEVPQQETDSLLGRVAGHLVSTSAPEEFLDPQGKYKLVMKGSFSAIEVAITPNDGVKTEGRAMVSMSNNVDLEAKMEGSATGACFRSCCAWQSFFFTHYTLLEGTRGNVLLAPSVPGDIILINLDGQQDWAIQKQGYLASDLGVSIGVKTQGGAQGCCSGEGFFIVEARGIGRVLLSSYGGILRYDLQPGEVRKINNGFLVAWHSSMPYTIKMAGSGLVNSVLSGEGFVASFTGPGTVYIQSRAISALASALKPYLPQSSDSAVAVG